MIDEAPLLTVKRSIPRPTRDLVSRFAELEAAAICDAMDGIGALDCRIRPVPGLPTDFAGVAVTCDCGPADNLAAAALGTLVQPGDVVVAATDSFTKTAVLGNLMIGMLKNCGVVAVVTDGAVRDLPDLQKIGLPVFSTAVTPNSPHRSGPGTVGLPVVCGGVPVAPGDIVVGSLDGVVVVPQAIAEEVLARAEAIQRQERELDVEVAARRLNAPPAGTDVMAGGRIRFVD